MSQSIKVQELHLLIPKDLDASLTSVNSPNIKENEVPGPGQYEAAKATDPSAKYLVHKFSGNGKRLFDKEQRVMLAEKLAKTNYSNFPIYI